MGSEKFYTNDSANSTDEVEDDHEISSEESTISAMLRFWVLLIPSILAIICSLFVLWVILGNVENRRSLHYRIIIIQLIAGLIFLLTHMPLYLNYLVVGHVWPKTAAICQFWRFFGEGYADSMTILMAWGSFERHILIFHDRWSTTRKKRILMHYLPLVAIMIYYLTYYFVVSAFPPCADQYDYNEKFCALSCLYRNRIFEIYDTMFNDILATLLVAVFSVSLIFRIICQSRVNVQTRQRSRKHRKLITILLTVSMIYLIFNLPLMILVLGHIFGLSEEIVERIEPYFEFLNYFIIILYPFICFSTIFQKFLHNRRRRLITPAHMLMAQQSIAPRLNGEQHLSVLNVPYRSS